jgi:adenylate kinase
LLAGIFTGVPKQLSGVAKLLQMMDWESEEGEENAGMVGEYINFGSIGKENVVDAHTNADGEKVENDDVFILIAPQSMVGIESSIMGPLAEMVEAAGDRPVILVNPDLRCVSCIVFAKIETHS